VEQFLYVVLCGLWCLLRHVSGVFLVGGIRPVCRRFRTGRTDY